LASWRPSTRRSSRVKSFRRTIAKLAKPPIDRQTLARGPADY
jgi:hypothetical protein